MAYLVTGSAGFIGYHLSRKLLDEGVEIIGSDNLNDYYDVSLKEDRNKQLKEYSNYTFYKADLADYAEMEKIFTSHKISHVVHLGAQAGVRYSIDHPLAYLHSNLAGFMNMLELCRHYPVKHLVYASSSSVYGMNTKTPFSESDNVDHPVSLYAATKKSNELLAHSYADIYGIPCTGLRFFTVYGPYGRPDMAYFKFSKAIMEGRSIDIYNQGDMFRDFTYIDDIVAGIFSLIDHIPRADSSLRGSGDPSKSRAPYRVFNIGNNTPVKLSGFISILEEALGKKALKNYLPMQPGDVYMTYADIDNLAKETGYKPKVSIEEGLKKFVAWFRDYYHYTA